MRIAFYNIQNLFFRNQELLKAEESRNKKSWVSELDKLISQAMKRPQDLVRIRELSFLLKFDKIDMGRYAEMRRRGGTLFLNKLDYPTMEKASRTNGWNGWIELKNYPLDSVSITNKARVISEVQPDLLVLQDVEDRESLVDFNEKFIPEYPGTNFREVYTIPSLGNSGSDQALLIKKVLELRRIQFPGRERLPNGRLLFDRACSISEFIVSGHKELIVVSVQLEPVGKDKDFSDTIRIKQIRQLITIYKSLQAEGYQNIILAGTFNAYSYCCSIAPLFQETDLKNICRHSNFTIDADFNNATYHRLGAYARGINIRQQNYLLVSPALYEKIEKAGINRKAMWAGTTPQWEMYKSIKNKQHQASKHPMLWIDLSF